MDLRGDQLELDASALKQKADRDRKRLDAVIAFAYARSCRQKWILDYFGEANSEDCGQCDRCLASGERTILQPGSDDYILIQKALSGVARMSRHVGPNQWQALYGKRKIIQCLVGSQSEFIHKNNLDRISTYGLLKSKGSAFVEALFDELEAAGLIANQAKQTYPLCALTSQGAASCAAWNPQRSTCPCNNRKQKGPAPVAHQALYTKLVNLRREMAQCPQTGLCHLSQFCVDRARKPTAQNHGRSHQNKRDRPPQTARNFTCLFRLYSKTSNGAAE